MALGPIHMWARVGAAPAARAGGMSAEGGGAGKRARRSGAQPGLDEVEKPVTVRLANRAPLGQVAQRLRHARLRELDQIADDLTGQVMIVDLLGG